MFEKLYKCRRVLARHQTGPMAKERVDYLSHRARQGAAKGTLLNVARELLVISREINLIPGHAIEIAEIEAAAKRWARRQQRRHRALTQKWSRELFVLRAKQWFEFLGRLQKPEEKAVPFSNLINDFAIYLCQVRGLSSVTIDNYYWHIGRFLTWLDRQDCHVFADVSINNVDEYIALNGISHWTRVSVASCSNALRAFFRHSEMRKWCVSGIAASIESPRIFKQENLPSGPSWKDVQRLISSTSTDQPRDIRDRALLMLFAIYGLRSGEVRKLCLENIDWEREILQVSRPKQRKTQEYPLTHQVGQAIIRYLKEVRPCTAHREVFLTLKAPFRPLSAGALNHVTETRFAQLGIESLHRGPHSLRHACATYLLSQGLSFKEIGDHLGHRSSFATSTYAKVDITGLREVASFDMGGLL